MKDANVSQVTEVQTSVSTDSVTSDVKKRVKIDEIWPLLALWKFVYK